MLDELSELEAKRYERHLKKCASCRREVQEWQQLHARIVADFHQEQSNNPRHSTQHHSRRSRTRRGGLSNLGLVAAMMMISAAACAAVLPMTARGSEMASDIRQKGALALQQAVTPLHTSLSQLHGATVADLARIEQNLHQKLDLHNV